MSPTPRVIGRGLDVCIWEPDFPGGQILSVCRFSQRIIGAITTSALEGLTSGLRFTHSTIPLKRCSLAVSTKNWCRWPERSPATGWKGQKAPVGHLHRPALFAPWRMMWRPVFPGCHTHSGGFAIHAGRCLAPLERIMGIEPTFAAWEAAVLPMNYIRVAALPGLHRGTVPRTASVYLRATLGR